MIFTPSDTGGDLPTGWVVATILFYIVGIIFVVGDALGWF